MMEYFWYKMQLSDPVNPYRNRDPYIADSKQNPVS